VKKSVAAVDIGTNSIRLLIQKPTPTGWVNQLQRRSIVRMGSGWDKEGNVPESKIQKAKKVLFEYRNDARKFEAEKIIAVGTEALRKANNGGKLKEKLEKILGKEIRIISGQEEARLSYLGAAENWIEKKPWVLDIGGGSTELIGPGKEVVSFPIGALNLYERFGEEDLDLIEKEISNNLAEFIKDNTFEMIIGVGGTIANLAAMKKEITFFQEKLVHGTTLDLSWVIKVIGELRSLPLLSRKKVKGLEVGREDIIIPGTLILKRVMELTGRNQVVFSGKDILQGIILDWEESQKKYPG